MKRQLGIIEELIAPLYTEWHRHNRIICKSKTAQYQVRTAEWYLEINPLVFWYGSAASLFIIMHIFV